VGKSDRLVVILQGYPIANLPLGVTKSGEPFGLAFFVCKHQEGSILQAMNAFETLPSASFRVLREDCLFSIHAPHSKQSMNDPRGPSVSAQALR